MMQPRHWLDQLPARTRSGLRELMGGGYRADRRSNFSRKSARRKRAVSGCVNFRAHPLKENGLFRSRD
jgi:hypothetical protein